VTARWLGLNSLPGPNVYAEIARVTRYAL
jgi:hypothetical protein